MDELRAYLNSLEPEQQKAYAARCKTTVGYLRKAISIGQQLAIDLSIALDRESGGKVHCSALRPDVDWNYLRARLAS